MRMLNGFNVPIRNYFLIPPKGTYESSQLSVGKGKEEHNKNLAIEEFSPHIAILF